VRFLDLGPLAVEIDGAPRTLGGRRVESVAAALLVNLGAPLPAAALVDAVWGTDPPAGAGGALDSLIWRLRRVLEPGRAGRDAALVRRDEQGYRLVVAPDTIDSQVLTAGAAAADATTDADDALRIADDSLGRWRGTPYDGLPDPGLDPVRTRLAEVRVTLQHHRLDALLAVGHPDRAVADLVPLLVEHPYRESLWERRLRALYASGRQQAALAAFHELRRTLADELGVEPGLRLRRLHERILAHDPALQPRVEVHVTAPLRPGRAVEVHLPRRSNPFVGRDDERRGLVDRLTVARVVTLTGPGGCGKTRLAIEAAGEAHDHFPDGVWFVDLSAVTDADPDPVDRIAVRLAATLGLDPGARRTALDALRDFAAERAVLLLLDNCEQVVDGVAAVVEAVVDAAPAVAVLATSRQPLGVDDEVVQNLAPLALPVADTPDARMASPAIALFVERIRARGEPAELDGPDGAAIARICAAVDGLPLGIELAAARVGTFTLAEIADGLGREPGTLSRLGRGPSRQRNLHEEVDWSYRLATPDERIAHRRLAVLPRPFTLDAAEAVCAMPPLRPGSALDLVGGLAHRSLLASARASRPGGPTWFGQLDTIRAHARGVLRESGEEEAVIEARTRWVVDQVAAAPRYGRPGQIAWFDWLDDNRATIDATLEEALDPGAPTRPSEELPFTVVRLARYWIDRMHVVTGRRLVRLAADVPWSDPLASAAAAVALGAIQAVDQDMDEARPRLLAALPVLLAAPEERWADVGDLLTGMAAAVWTGDDWSLAAEIARTAAGFGERTADVHVVLTARALVSAADLIVDDAQEAMTLARTVLAEEARIGDDFAALFAAVTLGIGSGFAGDPEAGLAWTEEILRRQTALGIHDVGDVLEQRGGHLDAVGRPDDAVRTLSASAARQRRVGRTWPRTEGTAERLEQLRSVLGTTRFTLAWRAGQDPSAVELPGPVDQQPGSRAAR
jgi:predicted ATPase/DNA-binding SARP family transcriptional activator